MNYEEYITDIQQAAKEYLSTGNIIFGILLLIGIIAGLLFFFIYVRKEYYRKRSEIDTFLIEDKQKTDIFVPGLSDKQERNPHKKTFFEKLYNSKLWLRSSLFSFEISNL